MIIEKRRKKRLQLRRKEKSIIVLVAIVSGILGPYVGFFLYAMEEYNQFAYNLEPPDSSRFVELNTTLLYSMAMWFEDNIHKYHKPNDMIVNTRFNSSVNPSNGGGHPVGYSVSYDSAEWTGHYLMAEAFRYKVHKRDGNLTLADYALGNISNTLRGVDEILHVSGNGGMARYVWTLDEYAEWGMDPNNIQNDNHYQSTWNGTEYIFEDDTSRDMHNGIIMGLGFTYLLVDNAAIRANVTRLVEDMLDYFLETGWLYMMPDNDPGGTDLNAGFWLFGTSGIWTLAYLKVGVLVNPTKYGPIYQEYAIERDYAHQSSFPFMSRTNIVQAYYGLLLDWELLFFICMTEENPDLRAIYIDYIGQVYDYTKYDRTAIFHSMWLAINGVTRFNANEEQQFIINDTIDVLMRYSNATQRLPGRNINLTNPDFVNPISQKWVDFFTEGIGAILYPFWHEIYQFEIVAKVPLTPDFRPQTDYLWSRSPYDFQETNQDGKNEGPSVDYIAVYWMCRYYDIIGPPDNFNATITVTYPGD